LESFIPDPGKHPLLLGENFAHCPSWIFSFIQLEKVFHDLKRYKNPGLGMKSPTYTPQSWKHPGNLVKSQKYPGNLAESQK
jgi:hypothetical protein